MASQLYQGCYQAPPSPTYCFSVPWGMISTHFGKTMIQIRPGHQQLPIKESWHNYILVACMRLDLYYIQNKLLSQFTLQFPCFSERPALIPYLLRLYYFLIPAQFGKIFSLSSFLFSCLFYLFCSSICILFFYRFSSIYVYSVYSIFYIFYLSILYLYIYMYIYLLYILSIHLFSLITKTHSQEPYSQICKFSMLLFTST